MERDRNGQRREKMILPRVFVFSMSRPTFRPTLSIFDLLCTITGCGAAPRKCVWQGGGGSRRLDKCDAGHLRKEMFSPPDISGTNPTKMISPSLSCRFLTPGQKAPTRGLTTPQRVHGRLSLESLSNRHTGGDEAVHLMVFFYQEQCKICATGQYFPSIS